MTIALANLILVETKTAIYNAALSIANVIGLNTSSWQVGDPTRVMLYALAELIEERDLLGEQAIRAGFLDYATGDWLKILAEQQFGVIVPGATYATTDVVLSNPGGGYYPDNDPGDLTFKNPTTGKTYHNTTGGIIASGPGTTLTVTVIADEPGSDSSAAAGEITEMVTPRGSVTCTNPLAAIGVDEQSEETTRAQCRARRARATPNGPRDAYTDVALDPDLTGTTSITRARAFADSDYGDVTVYLAGPNGAVATADRDLVEAAILANATPLCITPTVLSVSNVVVPVTFEAWMYASSNLSEADFIELAESALEQLFASRPVGGDIIAPATVGSMYTSLIESTIRSISPFVFRVELSAPAANVTVLNNEVAALGTVTGTVNIVKDPT